MWLIIDDQRELGCDLIARNFKAGKAILDAMQNQIECLCIDHDLGSLVNSGYDLIVWAIEAERLPDKVQIVSSNPVGRDNIIRALLAAGYVKNYADNLYEWKRS